MQTRKLRVARIFAEIYHYGWVRPPRVMTTKTRTVDPRLAKQLKADSFDYGPLNKLSLYNETHPEVLKPWINKIFDWEEDLQFHGKRKKDRRPYKHERLKYRILSFIEYTLLRGRQIGGFRNYEIIRNYSHK